MIWWITISSSFVFQDNFIIWNFNDKYFPNHITGVMSAIYTLTKRRLGKKWKWIFCFVGGDPCQCVNCEKRSETDEKLKWNFLFHPSDSSLSGNVKIMVDLFHSVDSIWTWVKSERKQENIHQYVSTYGWAHPSRLMVSRDSPWWILTLTFVRTTPRVATTTTKKKSTNTGRKHLPLTHAK